VVAAPQALRSKATTRTRLATHRDWHGPWPEYFENVWRTFIETPP
jgi:hypothetical protein